MCYYSIIFRFNTNCFIHFFEEVYILRAFLSTFTEGHVPQEHQIDYKQKYKALKKKLKFLVYVSTLFSI